MTPAPLSLSLAHGQLFRPPILAPAVPPSLTRPRLSMHLGTTGTIGRVPRRRLADLSHSLVCTASFSLHLETNLLALRLRGLYFRHRPGEVAARHRVHPWKYPIDPPLYGYRALRLQCPLLFRDWARSGRNPYCELDLQYRSVDRRRRASSPI
jgi:hypothetical protein